MPLAVRCGHEAVACEQFTGPLLAAFKAGHGVQQFRQSCQDVKLFVRLDAKPLGKERSVLCSVAGAKTAQDAVQRIQPVFRVEVIS